MRRNNNRVRTIREIEQARAVEPVFGKGIGVASGFDLGAQSPLDTRTVVHTLAERDGHVIGNRAYEGMLVYVEEDKKTYQYINAAWEEFGFSDTKFQENIEPILQKNIQQDNRLETLEGLVVGGEGEGLTAVIQDVATNKADIAVLKTDVTDLDGRLTVAEGTISSNTAAITAETTARQNAVNAINTDLDTIEGNLSTVTTDLDALEEVVAGIDLSIANKAEYADLEAEAMRAIAAETALGARLTTIEGTGAGSIKQSLADAKTYTDQEVAKAQLAATEATSALATRVTAVETAVGQVDAKITASNSNAKAYTDSKIAVVNTRIDGVVSDIETLETTILADAKLYTDTEVAAAKTEVNAYTDTKISNLVGAAPEALDTLYEIADALGQNQASIGDILTQVGLKADKTYVDAELLKKASTTYVDGELAKKADKTEVNALAADITALEGDLALEITNRTEAISSLTTIVNEASAGVEALTAQTKNFVPLVSSAEPTGYITGHVWIQV